MCVYVYISLSLYIYIYIMHVIHTCVCVYLGARARPKGVGPSTASRRGSGQTYKYGKFSEFHVWFCGLDPGNLKFETVRTNKQQICF